jgi:3-deoxy-D-manno-octulosonic-acid transferase
MEICKNHPVADSVSYLPLDTAENAFFFLERIQPKAVFFVRNDIWPNYINECYQRQIPVFLVSFTLNENSKFVSFFLKNFYRKTFQKISKIFVQDKFSEQILRQHAFNSQVFVAGNSRVDKVAAISNEKFHNREIELFTHGEFIVIAGSTHSYDLQLFIAAFSILKGERIKWIIVPHEIDKREMSMLKRILDKDIVCLSEFERRLGDEKLLLIDSVGMLSRIYRFTDLAFVGGGFNSSGIHSVLEPAIYGCPVCFGPRHKNYAEVLEMLRTGGARVVNNVNELVQFIMKFKNDSLLLRETVDKNKSYVSQSVGASEKILNELAKADCL